MPTSAIRSFDRLASRLHKERQFHQEALEEIDAIFAKHSLSASAQQFEYGYPVGAGITAVDAAKAPKPPKTRGRQHRRRFPETAEAFIHSLVSGKGASTAEINKAWTDSGRGGKADNTLSSLTTAKKLKRTANKNGRGSTYTKA